MRLRTMFAVGLSAVTLLVLVVCVVVWRPTLDHASPKLAVRRIAPDPTLGDVISVSPNSKVELTFEAENLSSDALVKLQLNLPCACLITRSLPDILLPHAKATFSFELSAPVAGVIQRVVQITRPADQAALAEFRCTLQTDVVPPVLLAAPPTMMLIRRIDGRPTECAWQFETIESADAAPWVADLAPDPPTGPKFQLNLVEEANFESPNLKVRKYRVSVSEESENELEPRQGQLEFLTAEGTLVARENWRVERLPRFLLHPQPLLIPRPADAADAVTGTIRIVDRLGKAISHADCVDERVKIEKLIGPQSGALSYSVRLTDPASDELKTFLQVSPEGETPVAVPFHLRLQRTGN